jgi:hypothetical protein
MVSGKSSITYVDIGVNMFKSKHQQGWLNTGLEFNILSVEARGGAISIVKKVDVGFPFLITPPRLMNIPYYLVPSA